MELRCLGRFLSLASIDGKLLTIFTRVSSRDKGLESTSSLIGPEMPRITAYRTSPQATDRPHCTDRKHAEFWRSGGP